MTNIEVRDGRGALPESALSELAIVALAFLVGVVLSHPIPMLLLEQPPRFASWFDQGQYLTSARALFHGDLSPGQHWYPMLYPLLLAPFAGLPPLVQTTLVDTACFLAAYWGFREVARLVGLTGISSAVVFLLSTVAWPQIGSGWLMPWTTTPSAALIWLALAWTTRTLDRDHPQALSLRRAAALGVVLALIPLGRPGDVPVAALIGAIAAWGLIRHERRWDALGAIIGAGLAVVALGLALHLAIHGPRPSLYMLLSAAYGTNLAWTGWKAYLLLVEPRPWYPEGYGLLRVLPWLPFGLAGLLLLLLADARRRMLGLLLVLPAAACTVVMLAYIDLLPSGLWAFGNVHYFKWLLPALALGMVHWLSRLRHRPAAAALAVTPLLLLGALRLDPVPVAADRPARLVVFEGVDDDGALVYFGHSSVEDAAGAQRNLLDVHLVPAPDQHRVLGEALRRDFAGNEVWHDVPRGVSWPVNPMEVATRPLHGPFPRRPVARYAPALGIGWPCWLPPYACPVTLPQP